MQIHEAQEEEEKNRETRTMVIIRIPQTDDATVRKLSPGIVVRKISTGIMVRKSSTRILVRKFPTTFVVRK